MNAESIAHGAERKKIETHFDAVSLYELQKR
jgi:hypothetical protein